MVDVLASTIVSASIVHSSTGILTNLSCDASPQSNPFPLRSQQQLTPAPTPNTSSAILLFNNTMSTTITDSKTLSDMIKQLHEASCELLYKVEAIIKAKEALGLPKYIDEHYLSRLVIAFAIAPGVADYLRSLLSTYDTP
jgi:hypothetical protein